ncbi:MAG: hypothetical protein AABX33_00820 [Nanoarchaeota archaeon]
MQKILLIVTLIIIAGCAQSKNFSYGIQEINKLNSKYGTTMETYPKNIREINLMLNEFKELKKLELENGKEPFNYVIDYKILNLESENLYIESQKYGSAATTKKGFGCKSRPFILESVALRNQSAKKGFEAVDLLREFNRKYPKEADSVGLSEKAAMFLNATFYIIDNDAIKDSNTINRFCSKNRTLEIYQEELRKKTNLSEESIKKLSYEEAVDIWKQLREAD